MHIGSGFVKAWMLGQLGDTRSGRVFVQGIVGVDPLIVLLFGMLLLIPIGALILTGTFGALLLGSLITTIGIAFLYYSAMRMRYDLVGKLETLLLD